MNSMTRKHRPQFSATAGMRGVGLIEVLVAVAILGFGLIGIAALQATALRNSQSSFERSQAVTQTYSILDRMRANQSVVHAGGYNTTLMCQDTDVPDDGGALAKNDLSEWLADVQKIMGSSACGKIECNFDVPTNTHECKVTVQWDDSRGTKGSDVQALTTSTAL